MNHTNSSLFTPAVESDDPIVGLRRLLKSCADYTGSASARLYLLDLAESAYVSEIAFGPESHKIRTVSLLETDDNPADQLLREVITSKTQRNVRTVSRSLLGHDLRSSVGSRLVAPLIRDRACLGMLDLATDEPEHFTAEHEQAIQMGGLVATLLSEKQSTLNLLRELQKPVSYRQPFDQFLDEIATVIGRASRLPVVVLRELHGETLRCLTGRGLPATTSIDELGITPVTEADNPGFWRTISDRKIYIENNMRLPYVMRLLNRMQMDQVQCIVIVPILVGDDVWGTLSFGVFVRHHYTPVELRGLEMIANAVGIAISNYRNFEQQQIVLFDQARLSAAVTTVDVAQSIRHEALNHLQGAREKIALAMLRLRKGCKAEETQRLLSEIDELHQEMNLSLGKIRTITRPPENERKRISLMTLWNRTFELVQSRLRDITWTVKGDATVEVAEDYLRNALLNLVLNSVDAFREQRGNQRFKIEVTIEPATHKFPWTTIEYIDNAGGIAPRLLRYPGPDTSSWPPQASGQPLKSNSTGAVALASRSVNDIFLPGVTSKTEGSGYGLYLVRKIFAEHGGSIDLVDYLRGGVKFKMTLPRVP